MKQHLIIVDMSMVRLRKRPHSVALIILLAIGLTIASVATAPTKTAAQLRVEAGERLVKKQEEAAKKNTKTPPAPRMVITDGSQITAVGDSVMLAGSPALQAKYPSIIINAEVSRSLRRGGLETIANLKNSGQLRDVVIVGLATNGYFGSGGLDLLMAELANHHVVLVTAYVDREWTTPNNQEIERTAKKYKNVVVAEWDKAIAPHPEFLAPDGYHPTANGDAIYIDAISTALSKFQ